MFTILNATSYWVNYTSLIIGKETATEAKDETGGRGGPKQPWRKTRLGDPAIREGECVDGRDMGRDRTRCTKTHPSSIRMTIFGAGSSA